MFIEIFQNSSIVESLAWTLLHSVWQISFIAFLLLVALRVISKTNASLRYLFTVSALSLALILPIGTFFYLSQFPFSTSNKHGIAAKVSEKNLQEQFETSEESIASRKNLPEATNGETASSIGTWQDSLEQTFAAYSPILVAFWLIGILLCSLRLFGGFWQLHRYRTQEVSDLDNTWQIRFIEICEKLEIKQRVKLLQSKLVESPMVIGWIKPVILVPSSIFLQMNPSQLETIIAHELMHIKRFDYLVNFGQSFVEILFFYHPCVRWISAKIRQERECACDDAVLQTLENAEFTYANALANLEAFRDVAKRNDPQLSIAANGGKLMNRIERIVKKETKTNRFHNSLWSASLASMLTLAFLVTAFWANSSPDVNKKTDLAFNSERKMAVGFVVIPGNYKRQIDESVDETSKLLINKLQKNKVPAIGFVEGSRLVNFYYKDSVRTDVVKLSEPKADILRAWRDAGFEIGVGNFGHKRFYDTDYDEYVSDVKSNIDLIAPILAEENLRLRYFSYPYLNTGKSIESKLRFEQWLAENSLQFIPYTFDNQEWIYAFAYDKARRQNNPEMMNQVKRGFLEYMKNMVIHYEAYSNDLFQREIPQTLVLTTSRLVADSANELFGLFRNRGYEFVSMQEALKDEAYRETETFTGRAGISWMERWTLTRGKKLRDEPKVADAINDMWKNRKRNKSLTPPPPPPAPPKPPKPPKPTKARPPAVPVAPLAPTEPLREPLDLQPPVAPKPPRPPSQLKQDRLLH